jgi:hypothetical protein
MKLYETESLSEKQRDKLTSYFKLAKKLKKFQNGCTPLVMIALFGEKEGDRLWVSLQANVIETLICGYLLVLRTKDIFWTNSEIRKSLQRDKRIWRNINRQHYV